MTGQLVRLELGDGTVQWVARANGVEVTAVAPAGLVLTAEPFVDHVVRGVKLVDADGREWGSAFVRYDCS